MSTQWRSDGGPIGLDYGALPTVLRMCRVPEGEEPEVFDGLRIMEDVALETMRKQAKRKAAK